MRSGVLLYKCRRCGKINKDTHTPDGIITIAYVMNDIPLPKEWGVQICGKTGMCNCGNENIGVSDLIGFERDLSTNQIY
jgi:hypothetical protein